MAVPALYIAYATNKLQALAATNAAQQAAEDALAHNTDATQTAALQAALATATAANIAAAQRNSAIADVICYGLVPDPSY